MVVPQVRWMVDFTEHPTKRDDGTMGYPISTSIFIFFMFRGRVGHLGISGHHRWVTRCEEPHHRVCTANVRLQKGWWSECPMELSIVMGFYFNGLLMDVSWIVNGILCDFK